MLRHPASVNIQPPINGAIAGARPKNSVIWAITRCACAGVNRSLTTARETTMPAPVDSPCRARKRTSAPIESDSAQPTEAIVNTPMPASTTGRRPMLSDNAPWNRFIAANANR